MAVNEETEARLKRRWSRLLSTAEDSSPGRGRAALVLFIVALALRLPGADSAHFDANSDETAIVRNVCTMQARGSMDPLSFHYPSLHKYLLLPVIGIVRQAATPLFPADAAFLVRPEPFLDASRFVSEFAGAATVVVVFVLAESLWGMTAGVFAGAFLLGSPLHAVHSGYATTDAFATLLSTLALFFSCGIATGAGKSAYVLAGICSGLAAGTKYPVGLVFVAVPMAHALAVLRARRASNSSPPAANLVSAGIACGAAFLAASPYMVLHPTSFLEGFRGMFASAGDMPSIENPGPDFLFYPWALFQQGLLPIPCVLALAGAAAVAWKRDAPAIVAGFVAVAFLAFFGAFHTQLQRYSLPAVPALCVLAGFGVSVLASLRPVATKAVAWTGAASGFAFVTWLGAQTLLGSTRTQALHWIATALPPGTRILKEVSVGGIESLERAQAGLSLMTQADQEARGEYLRLWKARARLHVNNMTEYTERYDLALYRSYGPDIVVTAASRSDRPGEYPDGAGKPGEFYSELRRLAKPVQRISPSLWHRGPTYTVWRMNGARSEAARRMDYQATWAVLEAGASRNGNGS